MANRAACLQTASVYAQAAHELMASLTDAPRPVAEADLVTLHALGRDALRAVRDQSMTWSGDAVVHPDLHEARATLTAAAHTHCAVLQIAETRGPRHHQDCLHPNLPSYYEVPAQTKVEHLGHLAQLQRALFAVQPCKAFAMMAAVTAADEGAFREAAFTTEPAGTRLAHEYAFVRQHLLMPLMPLRRAANRQPPGQASQT
jgi:hypothetical protein